MVRSVLVLAVTAFFLGITFQEASALKCWRCSSQPSNAAFCDDPFNPSILSKQQRRWGYVECSHPPGLLNPYSSEPNQIPFCKKIKQSVYNESIILRMCHWQDVNDSRNACINDSTPDYIRNEFCETCNTDGCNGTNQFGSVAVLVVIPTIIAKILSF